MKENNNPSHAKTVCRIIICVPKEQIPEEISEAEAVRHLVHFLEEEQNDYRACAIKAHKTKHHHSEASKKVHWSNPAARYSCKKVRIHKAKACKPAENKESFISEVCPHCDAENTFIWDVTKNGMTAFCAHCGKPILICSMCEDQRCGKCPHETK